MANFNRKEFQENLKRFRKAKGYSQDDLAKMVNLDRSAIAKYETGNSLPPIDVLDKICKFLDISINDLYDTSRKINNIKNSKNPFDTDTLYLYYIARDSEKKFIKGKYVLRLYNRDDICRVDFYEYSDLKTIYLSGYVLADDQMVYITLENYIENNRRLEVTNININIVKGIKGLLNGILNCTDGSYNPTFKKVFLSTTDLPFTDEMFKALKFAEKELSNLSNNGVLYVDLNKNYNLNEE